MLSSIVGTANASRKSNLALYSWALYDWANSAFASVIQTFVFAAYFVSSVAATPAEGSAAWGTITGISAFIVAVISPFFGAIADHTGGHKWWVALFSLLCIIPTALLWFILPAPEYMQPALWLVGIGAIGAEGAFIFYNAMLPELAPPGQLGRWSGWGWGMGYAGGMMALILSLFLFVSDSPLIVLDGERASVRATFLLTASWFTFFALPFFFFVPKNNVRGKTWFESAREGVLQLLSTFREIRKYKTIVHFLIAKIFYIDGLATLFAFGGIYAASVFGMESSEVLQFGIAMNLIAGAGAAVLAPFDDWFGSKKVILFSLVGLIIPGTLALFAQAKWQFWVLGLLMCIFVGPVQSSSRALMARLAPAHMRREMFGFYTLSGKATAFFGPLLYGWVSYLTGSLRWGMSTIILLFLLGGLLLLSLPKTNRS